MNEKIQEQLQKLDGLVFELRMALSALQNDLFEGVTVSIKMPTEQYNTTLFEASPYSPESETEPDGFHGKSYKDYQKSCLADTVETKE
tara:strand:+ start:219 stop:482 length:264 start_codon:yes stop_codon:yes gene_type:complete